MNRLIKSLSIPLILVLSGWLILVCTENYLKSRYDRRLLADLSEKKFIPLRNLVPNSDLVFTPSEIKSSDSFQLEKKDYHARTDNHGFIVGRRKYEHPDLKFVFLGGSIPQSLYMDDDKRMPEAVTINVEKETGLKINTWNCAAGGTNTYHTLNVLNNSVYDLQPDYAFFYANINDIVTMMHYGKFDNPNLKWGVFFNVSEFENINRPKSDVAFPYIRSAFTTGLKLNPARDDFADVRDSLLIFDSATIIPPIRRVYKTIIASCKANNIEPVLITQVNLYDRLGYGWFKKNMPLVSLQENGYKKLLLSFRLYNDMMCTLAKEEGIILVDLPSDQYGFSDFYDPSHFNAKGTSLTSKIIANHFVELLNKRKHTPQTVSPRSDQR